MISSLIPWFYLVWVVCTPCSVLYAARKNHNRHKWFFLGTLLGPFALFALYKIKPEKKKTKVNVCQKQDNIQDLKTISLFLIEITFFIAFGVFVFSVFYFGAETGSY